MTSVILPKLQNSQKHDVEDFIETVASLFKPVDTEHKLNSELTRAGIASTVEKCTLYGKDEEIGEEVCLMNITFQIKKFFELPGVFQKIKNNTMKILQQNKLNNFINGTLWKEKMKNYAEHDFVIPYFFYLDAAQITIHWARIAAKVSMNLITIHFLPYLLTQ